MSYVQGFVIPVPTANKEAYLELSRRVWPVFKEYGATRTVETWADDIRDGTLTDFKMAVKATLEETVVLSWIVWPDKATYEAAEAKMQSDERMQPIGMPFDGKRMIYGGFAPIFDSDD